MTDLPTDEHNVSCYLLLILYRKEELSHSYKKTNRKAALIDPKRKFIELSSGHHRLDTRTVYLTGTYSSTNCPHKLNQFIYYSTLICCRRWSPQIDTRPSKLTRRPRDGSLVNRKSHNFGVWHTMYPPRQKSDWSIDVTLRARLNKSSRRSRPLVRAIIHTCIKETVERPNRFSPQNWRQFFCNNYSPFLTTSHLYNHAV